MPTRRTAWWIAHLSYPCSACGALPGARCTTASGQVADYVHSDRCRGGNQCANPDCHALLPQGAGPADLCARCAQVRALEVERATKHIRHHP